MAVRVSQVFTVTLSAPPRCGARSEFPFARRALVCLTFRSADRILHHGLTGCVATQQVPLEWFAAATFRFPAGQYRRLFRFPRRLPSEDVCNLEHR